jgi:hypothetical protein
VSYSELSTLKAGIIAVLDGVTTTVESGPVVFFLHKDTENLMKDLFAFRVDAVISNV